MRMRDILRSQPAFTGKMPDCVGAYLAEIKVKDQELSTSAGKIGGTYHLVKMEEEERKVILTVDLKIEEDGRMYVYMGGEMIHPKHGCTVDGDTLGEEPNIGKLQPNGDIQWPRNFKHVKIQHTSLLKRVTEPMQTVYQSSEMTLIGTIDTPQEKVHNYINFGAKDNGALVAQGHCAILSKDGCTLIEGHFKNGKAEGLQRLIKVSKRKPGCTTIREATFTEGLESGTIKQTKINGNNQITTTIEVKDGVFVNQQMPQVSADGDQEKKTDFIGSSVWTPLLA